MSQRSIHELRKLFDQDPAPQLSAMAGITNRWDGHGSNRFSYFADSDRFAVVGGDQEGDNSDLALAYGLTYRGSRKLILVLPEGHAFSTLQRAPWLITPAPPDVWLHDGKEARPVPLPSQQDTVNAFTAHLKPGDSLDDELDRAATASYLGIRSADVFKLVEWATKHPQLDPGHRKGERSWHCLGQRVLSIRPTSGGLNIRAGIHFVADPNPTAYVPAGLALDGDDLEEVKCATEQGIAARLTGAFKKPDEHWLQAVIRRNPSLVGVEQPALREVPAWRPRGASFPQTGTAPSAHRWGRGYIDIVGIDGHGDLRVIETKLSDKEDVRLILQGLDYYVWTCAYHNVLRKRLGLSGKALIQVHYVVGDTEDGKIRVSPFSHAQARALDPKIHWAFQTLRNWFHPDGKLSDIRSELLPAFVVPESE